MAVDIENKKGSIPEHDFRNRLTWTLYNLSKFRFFQAWLCCTSLLGLLGLIGGSHKVLETMWNASIQGVGLYLGLMGMKYREIISKNIETFSCELITEDPGVDDTKWDLIASRTNDSFFEEGTWHTPYCWYNGVHCRQVFRARVLKSAEKRSLSADQAISTYLQSIDAAWNGAHGEELKKLIVNSGLPLPKENYLSKCTWRARYWIKDTENLGMFFLFTISLMPYTYSWMLYSAIPIGFFCFFMSSRDKKRDAFEIQAGLTFLKAIVCCRPKSDPDIWDSIASYMNQYLFETGYWRTNEYFFDGKDCAKFFKGARFFITKLDVFATEFVELKKYIEEALEATES
ncbi:LANO_0C06458g1_1 [Lachancea nothofagi CBS 11611]|uniref:LANO_0C06458g1_1 n=1 Tax=Lachancea nothofagi CBS 11611 TaxID=1266666 RepID=A0A1G4J838_9SACH|nr:LANO_0C06458g1_1 [Lachancea nothofagi CBS 11611]